VRVVRVALLLLLTQRAVILELRVALHHLVVMFLLMAVVEEVVVELPLIMVEAVAVLVQ
jgi:hypothetical protein